jgi:hypothetical protein
LPARQSMRRLTVRVRRCRRRRAGRRKRVELRSSACEATKVPRPCRRSSRRSVASSSIALRTGALADAETARQLGLAGIIGPASTRRWPDCCTSSALIWPYSGW